MELYSPRKKRQARNYLEILKQHQYYEESESPPKQETEGRTHRGRSIDKQHPSFPNGSTTDKSSQPKSQGSLHEPASSQSRSNNGNNMQPLRRAFIVRIADLSEYYANPNRKRHSAIPNSRSCRRRLSRQQLPEMD